MLSIINYLRARYLGEKGQGMVEYAVILGIVVAIAVVLASSDGLKGSVTNLFNSSTNEINNIGK